MWLHACGQILLTCLRLLQRVTVEEPAKRGDSRVRRRSGQEAVGARRLCRRRCSKRAGPRDKSPRGNRVAPGRGKGDSRRSAIFTARATVSRATLGVVIVDLLESVYLVLQLSPIERVLLFFGPIRWELNAEQASQSRLIGIVTVDIYRQ